MARSSAPAKREGFKRTLAIRAIPVGGVSIPGSSATAHRPSHHEPPCVPGGGRSAPLASNRKVVNRCAVPPAVEVDGTGYVAKCPAHPKYRGLGKPRLPCEPCWAIYFGLSEACVNCGCQEIT